MFASKFETCWVCLNENDTLRDQSNELQSFSKASNATKDLNDQDTVI